LLVKARTSGIGGRRCRAGAGAALSVGARLGANVGPLVRKGLG
jgi:hypothetical protein